MHNTQQILNGAVSIFPLFTLLNFTSISLKRLRGAVFGTNTTVLLLIQYETLDTLIRKSNNLEPGGKLHGSPQTILANEEIVF